MLLFRQQQVVNDCKNTESVGTDGLITTVFYLFVSLNLICNPTDWNAEKQWNEKCTANNNWSADCNSICEGMAVAFQSLLISLCCGIPCLAAWPETLSPSNAAPIGMQNNEEWPSIMSQHFVGYQISISLSTGLRNGESVFCSLFQALYGSVWVNTRKLTNWMTLLLMLLIGHRELKV